MKTEDVGAWLAQHVGQLICVVANDWESTQGRLTAFTRQASGTWSAEMAAPVVLGRAGLAWGLGYWPDAVPACLGEVRQKAEGDGRAPAGLFSIDGLFGRPDLPSTYLQHLKMPFLLVHAGLKCVDDGASCFYNRVLDATTLPSTDWHSHEEMQRADARYDLGVLLGHNPEAVPGAGSCIFLHVWAGEAEPTAGCTAMSFEALSTLCAWLNSEKQPCFLLLPEAAYRFYQKDWGLPAC